ncbi:hypothetical protein NDR87_14370 [Nocardia sp. CDC159]|uniref:Transmembrane protein n=1 Tax=Nocardia pulmonis TaxID=2951408 RepID=A0A9X2E5W9_9NOCA|nr:MULTISPECIES: hypothetical protein [Nocardia]MCM6774394.1 hypothetical protein [Nocardia pulmonis]MCM6787540.1 hypothetical protein [Nocardia sp. CDC159]
MSIASGTAKALGATASAAGKAVGTVGGAAVGATTGAARGMVSGAVSGARRGMDAPTATALGVAAAGVVGLVEWPVVAAASGIAGIAYLARRGKDQPAQQDSAPKPRTETKSAAPARTRRPASAQPRKTSGRSRPAHGTK